MGSLCSGIEGFGRGLEQAGMELSWLCENNVQARSILRRHHPSIPLYDDIISLDGGGLSPVDVLIAGTPCTDLSVSGKRAGLDGSQSRLFFEFIRVLRETQPEWFIFENVVGLLSSHAGRDMDTALGCMADSGYGFAYRVLNAADLGVPQRRRRVIVVGHLGDWSGPEEVLFEPAGGDGDTPSSRQAGKSATRRAARGTGARSPVAALTATGVGTCGADDNQAQGGHLVATAYTVHGEHSTAMTGGGNAAGGFETDRTRSLDTTGGYATNQGGPVITDVPEVSYAISTRQDRLDASVETFIPEKVTALTARCGNVQDDQQVGQLIPIGFHLTQHPISSEDVFPAMGAGNARGCATMAVAIPIDIRNVAYSTKLHNTNSNGAGKWYEEYTAGLDASSPPPVAAFSENQRAEVIEHDIAHQLTSGGGTPGQGYAAVRQDMAVRRLTPIECERLMGLPDGWTEWGVNEAGVTVAIPDTHRYRCIGNSVAVPMAAWVARRLVAVDEARKGFAVAA